MHLHKLSGVTLSVDSSVVVDFYMTGSTAVLQNLFDGRMLMSDFVEEELRKASIHFHGATVVGLATDEEWGFFARLHTTDPGLGTGELGALTVAWSRQATLLTNDKKARQMADTEGVPVGGAIAVLEFGVEIGELLAADAVGLLEAMVREGAWISHELIENFKTKVMRAP